MQFYNAAQAARYIGVDDKTVRRWLKSGVITATRTRSNQLAIPAYEVERMKRERDDERAQFGMPRQDVGIPRQQTTHAQADLDQKISDLTQSITNLNTTISSQTRRIDELTRRVVDLETHLNTSQNVANPSVSAMPMDETPSPEIAQKSPSIDSGPIPRDTLSASEFAAKHGIKYDDMKNYMRRGINGEYLEITETPHYMKKKRDGTPAIQYHLTAVQQQKALALLKKHGKLPDV